MNWKCPDCGMDNAADLDECQGRCGFRLKPPLAQRVVLVSSRTSRQLAMRLSTSIGRDLLKSADPDEAIYASEVQFHIRKDEDAGDWIVTPESLARHPTFHNGTALTAAGAVLGSGDVLSIGPTRCRLEVQLEYA